MNRVEKTRTVAGDHKDLYIYLLKGPVKTSDESYLGSAFLGNWVEGNTSFLFFSRPSQEMIDRLIEMRLGLEMIEDYHFTYDQWQGGSLKKLKVDHFLVVPPWEKIAPDEADIPILLDPGVVFGNGLHPTTRDCLSALAFARRQRPFERVLDLGTGTGILALAAALLDAKWVLAVDLNPLCVKTANNNVKLNGLDRVIQVVEGSAENFVSENADIVIANIHHEIIDRLLEEEGFRKQKRLIISGLMRSQYRKVRARLASYDFRTVHEWDDDMTWFTMLVDAD